MVALTGGGHIVDDTAANVGRDTVLLRILQECPRKIGDVALTRAGPVRHQLQKVCRYEWDDDEERVRACVRGSESERAELYSRAHEEGTQ